MIGRCHWPLEGGYCGFGWEGVGMMITCVFLACSCVHPVFFAFQRLVVEIAGFVC